MEWDWKKIVMIVAVTLLFLGTNIGQYYVIWKPDKQKLVADYEAQLAQMQSELDYVYPLVDIWAISDAALDVRPGKQIEASDLTVRQIPESLLSRSFVLEPQTVVGKYFKVAMEPGTPLSMELVMDEEVKDTVREYDLVSNVAPIGLRVGDYIDYRIVYPLGEDYIVLSRKRVEAIHDKTIKVKLDEEEIHYYQAALVDYFLQAERGASLYMTKYVEPGIQPSATAYYAVPDNIMAMLIADPNIVRMIDSGANELTRTMIESGIAAVSDEDGHRVYSGRNDVAGKVDSAAVAKEQEDRDSSQRGGAAAGGGVAEDSSFYIQEGVVE